MKFLFDLLPVILFFITLKIAEKSASASLILSKVLTTIGLTASVKPDLVPIMLATVVVIAASVAQILWLKLRHGTISNTLLFSTALVVVMGGLTLYFQNAEFIKWKPTMLYWGSALAFLLSEKIWHKNIIKSMMGTDLKLPEPIWKKLNLAWVIFFIGMGSLNLYVAYNFSIDTWATFKLFGTMGLILIFTIAQSLVISKYVIEDK